MTYLQVNRRDGGRIVFRSLTVERECGTSSQHLLLFLEFRWFSLDRVELYGRDNSLSYASGSQATGDMHPVHARYHSAQLKFACAPRRSVNHSRATHGKREGFVAPCLCFGLQQQTLLTGMALHSCFVDVIEGRCWLNKHPIEGKVWTQDPLSIPGTGDRVLALSVGRGERDAVSDDAIEDAVSKTTWA